MLSDRFILSLNSPHFSLRANRDNTGVFADDHVRMAQRIEAAESRRRWCTAITW